MTSPISYANVAANASSANAVPVTATVPATTSDSNKPKSEEQQPEQVQAPSTTESSGKESDDQTTESTESTATSTSTSTPSKTKKTLAPAPVPTKSAWGAVISGVSQLSVDDKNWPSPEKAPLLGEQPNVKPQQHKFIKPITNKWVPINAKVILPNSRSGNNNNGSSNNSKLNRNRKKSGHGQSHSKSTPKKREDKVDGKDTKSTPVAVATGEEASNEENASSVEKKQTQPKEISEEQISAPSTAQEQDQEQDDQPSQHQSTPQQHQPRFNNGQQKKRFNNQHQPNSNGNGNANGQYQKRFNSHHNNSSNANAIANQQQPIQPQPFIPQGFFHPQSQQQYPNNYQYNNNGNRPYRNGQYRNNRNNNNQQYRNGGYRHHNNHGANGMMPGPIQFFPYPQQMPIQIPPPISPKQDPQEALIQQIDYYFSLENLIKDLFLRKNMDAEGWVDLKLILDFKRVKIIINGLINSLDEGVVGDDVILESIKSCNNLEIKEGEKLDDVKLRVKGDYKQWLLNEY